MKELQKIKRIAKANGFGEETINNLVEKHSNKIKVKQKTTLLPERTNETKRYCRLNFCGSMGNQIKSVFKRYNIIVAFANDKKIKNILGSTKDKDEILTKSGIYEISCPECDKIYIGQTRRNIETRFKEHRRHLIYNQPEKSAVAKHLIDHGSTKIITRENINLKKEVRINQQLDGWESFFMYKHKHHLINIEPPPITSNLFYLKNNF